LRLLPWELLSSNTAIQPLLIGRSDEAVRISKCLRERGILVPAIRPPTVPQGTARLRISLSAVHHSHDVQRLIQELNELSFHL
jgi:8-amino-7-oxononanoate synthase